jgi:hypothetical protein
MKEFKDGKGRGCEECDGTGLVGPVSDEEQKWAALREVLIAHFRQQKAMFEQIAPLAGVFGTLKDSPMFAQPVALTLTGDEVRELYRSIAKSLRAKKAKPAGPLAFPDQPTTPGQADYLEWAADHIKGEGPFRLGLADTEGLFLAARGETKPPETKPPPVYGRFPDATGRLPGEPE